MDRKKYKIKRFWEIDFLRGFAVIMMLVFHFFFDLNYFGFFSFDPYWFWKIFAYLIATIFIFLVGLSLTLSFSRVKKYKTKNELRIKYLVRGLKIFSLGLIITFITWIFLKQGFIIFGILHFIGVSIILAYPFLKFKYLNLFLGIGFILIGLILQNFTFNFYYLLWLGFIPNYFYTLDYFPIFPWFGIILIGIFFGNSFYPEGKRVFNIKEFSNLFTKLFCFLGRHSLLIYLVHQPMLISFLIFVL